MNSSEIVADKNEIKGVQSKDITYFGLILLFIFLSFALFSIINLFLYNNSLNTMIKLLYTGLSILLLIFGFIFILYGSIKKRLSLNEQNGIVLKKIQFRGYIIINFAILTALLFKLYLANISQIFIVLIYSFAAISTGLVIIIINKPFSR